MSRPNIKPGQVIGKVLLEGPYTVRYQDYETAAWFQEITAPAGLHDVTYGLDRSNRPVAVLQFTGPITDAYFGALWGGVPVSRNDGGKHRLLGKTETITETASFAAFVTNRGFGYPVEGRRYLPDPRLYHDLLWAARIHMNERVRWHLECVNRAYYRASDMLNSRPYDWSSVSGSAQTLSEVARERQWIESQEGDEGWQRRITEAWERHVEKEAA